MKIIKSFKSKDGKSTKYLQRAEDGNVVETGYYSFDEHVICVSSQVGCPMGCIFCASAEPIDDFDPEKRFIRNLNQKEIIQQVKNVLFLLKPEILRSKRILFSFMGMGEPFLNYQNVVQSLELLANDFPNSRVTIATLGIHPKKIKKIALKEFPVIVKLHLSLHAPNDSLRKKLLPEASKIKPSLEALKYFSIIRGVLSKVNYLLIRNLNDSEKHAVQLAKLLKPYPFIVKLSKLNPHKDLKPALMNKFVLFEKILHSYKIKTCRFISDGSDIRAGCGQFRRYFYPG